MPKNTPVKANKRSGENPSKKGTPQSASKKNSKKASKQSSQNTPTKATKGPKPSMKTKNSASSVIPVERVSGAIMQLSQFLSKKERSESTLIDDDELNAQVHLIATNAKSYRSTKNFKPSLLPVKHSIFAAWKKASVTSVKDFKILLILKDQDKEKLSEDDLYDLLEKPHGIKVDSVISGGSLKSTYHAFEKRRALLSEYSLILSDDSVVTTLPKLLGGKAYEKISTTPIPIRTGKAGNFSKTTLINSIKNIFEGKLPVLFPRGNTINVHLGNLEWFTPTQLQDNIISVSEQLVKDYEIRSIFVKSNDSPVLPLYYNQTVLDEVAQLKKDSEEPASSAADQKIAIDGVEVELSSFEKALLEVADPSKAPELFSKQINKAKRVLVDAATADPAVSAKKQKVE